MSPTRRSLPYGRQSISEADIEAVAAALRSERLTTGPLVARFEEAFARKVGAEGGAAACANGTAALHLAMLTLGIGPGDHVVVPSITFLATANAARFVGAEVAFADVDPDTGLMQPEHLEAAIAHNADRKLAAVCPVHLAGRACDMPALAAIARRHGLAVIEDACHALGTVEPAGAGGMPIGACRHSDLACFSFHPVKTITTGEGGMVTGRDPDLVARARRLASHGMVRTAAEWTDRERAFEGNEPNGWYYEMPEIGFNYRLTDIQSALGLSQLERLDAFIEARARLRRSYCTGLADLAPAVRMLDEPAGTITGWHLAVALFDFERLRRSRREVMRTLDADGVGTQVHYIPVHGQPYYVERYGRQDLPGAEAYYAQCLSLPLFPGMVEADVDQVVAAIRASIGGGPLMKARGRTLGLIPAKGGSVRLLRKNLRLLGGRPLIAWAAKALRDSHVIDRLVLSTEDEGVATAAREAGIEVPFMRPDALARDPAGVVDVALHALDALEQAGDRFQTLVIALPTCPFRTADDIRTAAELYSERDAEFLMSVSAYPHTPFAALRLGDDGCVTPWFPEHFGKKSQQMPMAFRPNGAVHVLDVAAFRRTRSYVSQPLVAHVMPEERSIDIDTEEDLREAEIRLALASASPGSGRNP